MLIRNRLLLFLLLLFSFCLLIDANSYRDNHAPAHTEQQNQQHSPPTQQQSQEEQKSHQHRNGHLIYISPNGKDSKKCGAMDRPCFTMFRGNVTFTMKNSTVVVMVLPGFYDYSKISYVLHATSLNVTVIGVAGSKYTKILLPSNGRFLLSVNSSVLCQGITFLNQKTSFGPSPLTRDPVFRSKHYTPMLDAVLLNFISTTCPFKVRNSLFYLVDIVSFNNSVPKFLISLDSNVAIINSTFQMGNHESMFEITQSIVNFYQVRLISNSIGALLSSNFSLVNLISTTIIYNRSEQGFFFNNSVVNIYHSVFKDNISIFGQLILASSNMNLLNTLLIHNSGLGVTSLLYHSEGSATNISECIFNENHSQIGSSIVNEAKELVISYTIFTGRSQFDSTIIAIYSNGELFLQNSAFFNVTGICITSDSASIVVITDTSFRKIEGRLVQSFGKGLLLFGSCVFEENASFEHLIYLANQVTGYIFNSRFIGNKCSSVFEINYEASISGVNMLAFSNIMQNAFITGSNSYGISFQYSSFIGNQGIYRGSIFEIDQSGSINITDSIFYLNTSPFGSFIYFKPRTVIYTHDCNNHFLRNSFFQNSVATSGALVYYENNIICSFRCYECFEYGNTAYFGELVNSDYYNFTADLPRNINTPQTIQVIITAMDGFGNRVRGRSDVRFQVEENCPNVNLTGINTVILNTNGIPIMYNLVISGVPGTTCNLNFTSMPPAKSGPLLINVKFEKCPSDDYLVHTVNSLQYCLKKTNISSIIKVIISTLTVIEMLLVAVTIILVIIYRKNRLMIYSNNLVNIITLIGCEILLTSIFFSEIVGSASCVLRNIVIPLGLFVTSLSVIVKEFRIWSIRKSLTFQKKILINNKYFFKWFSILCSVPAIIIILNAVVSPLKPVYIINLNNLTSTHTCYSEHSTVFVIINLVYLLLLLLFSCILIFISREYRSSPGTFNEPTYIAILIYNYILLLIILVPLRFSFTHSVNAQLLIVSATILVYVLSTILLLFVPKFNIIFRKKAVVSSMIKFIEEQEQQLERNKDILMFYELYGNDDGQLNFANHNIFSPNSPSPIQNSQCINTTTNDSNNNNNENKFNRDIDHSIPDASSSNIISTIDTSRLENQEHNRNHHHHHHHLHPHLHHHHHHHHENHGHPHQTWDLDAIYGSTAFDEPLDNHPLSPFSKTLKSRFNQQQQQLQSQQQNNNNLDQSNINQLREQHQQNQNGILNRRTVSTPNSPISSRRSNNKKKNKK